MGHLTLLSEIFKEINLSDRGFNLLLELANDPTELVEFAKNFPASTHQFVYLLSNSSKIDRQKLAAKCISTKGLMKALVPFLEPKLSYNKDDPNVEPTIFNINSAIVLRALSENIPYQTPSESREDKTLGIFTYIDFLEALPENLRNNEIIKNQLIEMISVENEAYLESYPAFYSHSYTEGWSGMFFARTLLLLNPDSVYSILNEKQDAVHPLGLLMARQCRESEWPYEMPMYFDHHKEAQISTIQVLQKMTIQQQLEILSMTGRGRKELLKFDLIKKYTDELFANHDYKNESPSFIDTSNKNFEI